MQRCLALAVQRRAQLARFPHPLAWRRLCSTVAKEGGSGQASGGQIAKQTEAGSLTSQGAAKETVQVPRGTRSRDTPRLEEAAAGATSSDRSRLYGLAALCALAIALVPGALFDPNGPPTLRHWIQARDGGAWALTEEEDGVSMRGASRQGWAVFHQALSASAEQAGVKPGDAVQAAAHQRRMMERAEQARHAARRMEGGGQAQP